MNHIKIKSGMLLKGHSKRDGFQLYEEKWSSDSPRRWKRLEFGRRSVGGVIVPRKNLGITTREIYDWSWSWKFWPRRGFKFC